MSKTAKWIIGIVIVFVVLQVAMPFVWRFLYPAAGGYGFWGNGYGMMGGGMMGGFGHMGLGLFGGLFMWLLPLGLLILIGLSIAYLWKKLNEKPVQE